MSERLLIAYIAGELDADEATALERELDESPQLFAKLVFLLSEETMLAELLHEEATAADKECPNCTTPPTADTLPNEELFTAYVSGRMGESEVQELEEQLESDAELKRELAEFCKQRVMLAEAFDPKRQRPRRRRCQQQPATKSTAGLWLKIAASIAILVSVVWLVRRLSQPKDDQLAHSVPPPPARAKTQIAHLAKIDGEVLVLRGGREFPLSTGSSLMSGDTIKNRSGSTQAVFDSDDTTITVRGETTLQINESADNTRQVDLSEGTITAKIAKQPPTRPMIFKTPNTRINVLGTEFILNVSGSRSQLEMVEGAVEVFNTASGDSRTVRKGAYAIIAGRQLMTGSLSIVKVVSFSLIDAQTKQPVQGFNPMPPNATVDLSKLPGDKLTIRANTVPMLVGRVKLELFGPPGFDTIKNFETKYPYLIKRSKTGDDYVDGNDYRSVQLPPGRYKIDAVVWDKHGNSKRSAPASLEFNIEQ